MTEIFIAFYSASPFETIRQVLETEPPSHIRVEFLRRVRAERKFDSPETLRAQILKDVATANRYFRRLKSWTGPQCISC